MTNREEALRDELRNKQKEIQEIIHLRTMAFAVAERQHKDDADVKKIREKITDLQKQLSEKQKEIRTLNAKVREQLDAMKEVLTPHIAKELQ